jgi:hypothetical protein
LYFRYSIKETDIVMSEVTNLILSFSIAENKASKRSEIELFHNNGRGFRLESADFEGENNVWNVQTTRRWYAGSKVLETPLFIGAYNHLDLDGLIEYLKTLEWEEPENVQLIVQEQHEYKFRIIEIV